MAETDVIHYLERALQSLIHPAGRQTQNRLPFHQALINFEMLQSRLALAPTPSPAPRPDSSELAHAPLLLSPLAQPKAYDYAVHLRSIEPGTRGLRPTWLLLYRTEAGVVDYLELALDSYTLLLAFKLASEDLCAISATELLLELAEYRDTDQVVHFVEQGLKLFSRLNDLGLIEVVHAAGPQ